MTAPARRTTWLLDFDGVLNASRPGWSRAPSATTVWANGQAWRVRWENKVVLGIRAAVSAGVDVRWSTSWIGDTDVLTRALGLPDLPDAFEAPGGHQVEVVAPRKLAAALAVVRSGSRLVWTDDNAIPVDGAARTELNAAGALLIAPTSSRGLRPDDLDMIAAYVANS